MSENAKLSVDIKEVGENDPKMPAGFYWSMDTDLSDEQRTWHGPFDTKNKAVTGAIQRTEDALGEIAKSIFGG